MAQPASSDDKSNENSCNKSDNPASISKSPSPIELKFDERDEEYLHQTEQKYLAQCESLLKNAENQMSLIKLLAYERYNDYPIASYLIDSYLVDKFQYYVKHESELKKIDLTIEAWAQGEYNHDILKNLIKSHKNHDNIHKDIVGGMDLYFKRYMRAMDFPMTYLINDKVERFAQCLSEANRLIKKIFKDSISIPPFQVIFVISVSV